MKDKYTLGALFARGGSKRVPHKNLRPLAGKPLIAHSIDAARQSSLIDRVVLSTDDEEIAAAGRRFGAEVPFMRPAELAGDSSSEWMAWQHMIRTLHEEAKDAEIEAFVCIPLTSPLRSVEDIDACIRVYREGGADVVITVKAAETNPYYNMVVLDDSGFARQVIETKKGAYRRDMYPEVFDMTTVAYVANPDFVLNSVSPFEGRVKAVVIPTERALDIDTELDFKFAEFILQQGV
jgi:N,N'-diacetyl-8-epilegionaminate cytidylyltransferase